MDKLKPCPFCGQNLDHKIIKKTMIGVPYYHIKCPNCGICTAKYNNIYALVNIWNERQPFKSIELDEVINKLNAHIGKCPLGYYNKKVIIYQSIREDDVHLWLVKLFKLNHVIDKLNERFK